MQAASPLSRTGSIARPPASGALGAPQVLLILLLLLAPLFRGGNTPFASLLLQSVALAVLVASL
jgi:hypothetical protein